MTKEEKIIITRLRNEGLSYSKVANQLGISENTVKSYCKRNNLGGIAAAKVDAETICLQCGNPLENSSKTKPRKFCSDSCRLKWWNSHPQAINRKAVYKLTCIHCGNEFASYGNAHRKYCSRACYGLSKRKTEVSAL